MGVFFVGGGIVLTPRATVKQKFFLNFFTITPPAYYKYIISIKIYYRYILLIVFLLYLVWCKSVH